MRAFRNGGMFSHLVSLGQLRMYRDFDPHWVPHISASVLRLKNCHQNRQCSKIFIIYNFRSLVKFKPSFLFLIQHGLLLLLQLLLLQLLHLLLLQLLLQLLYLLLPICLNVRRDVHSEMLFWRHPL